ncbi:MAG: glycosyltransferase involved in cell wall biosynthesis [Maribacter sp.]
MGKATNGMKILMVSSSILPYKGGSSIIVENLAKNFSHGEMHVLGSREWRLKDIPKRDKNKAVFHYFFSEMSILGRGARFFEWFGKLRFKSLIKQIKSIAQKEQIDHIIGVYPNALYCHAACLAAKEMNIPFSSYFHNTYIENKAITDPKAVQIQDEIFDYSQNMFVMSKGMQQFYEKKYASKKFIPLVHTFDQFPKESQEIKTIEKNKAHYKLVAIGNFNESNIDATQRFVKAIKSNPKYSLSLYTHVPSILLKNRGLDTDAIIHKGFVNPDEVHQKLQEFDICILTHGFTGGYGEIEYQTIFPTRTIPLLLSGKPIIAHSPKGSFLNDFIKENACAELVDEANTDAIIKGLEKIINDTAYQEQLIKNSKKTAYQFLGETVVKKLKNTLKK